MTVAHIYISPQHNFFGHHGKPPGDAEMLEVDEVSCVAGKGLEGDRFFEHKENYKGQVTFFSLETYERLCEQLGVMGKDPSVFRRNIIVKDIELNTLIGQEFTVQGICFKGTEEAKPCYWMEQAFGEGAEAAMNGYGGLRARILSDGILRRDA